MCVCLLCSARLNLLISQRHIICICHFRKLTRRPMSVKSLLQGMCGLAWCAILWRFGSGVFYQLNGAQTGWPVKGLLPWHFGSCGLQIVRGQRKGVPDAFSSIGRCGSDQFLGSIPCPCSGPYVMCGAASLVSTRECSCWIK